jgi:iron complex transport system substrate-binding protein
MYGISRRSTIPVAQRLSRLPVLAGLALLGALAACGGSSASVAAPATPVIARDALGQSIAIPTLAPQRIVSETAGDSEMLAAVGADARVVAVDFYTDYPADLAAKPKITDGQTFNLNVEAIIALKPDLVLGYNLFFKSDEQKLIAAGISVVDLPAATLTTSLTEIRLVGQLVHADDAAKRAVASLQQRIDAVKSKVAGKPVVSVYMEDGTYNGQFSVFGKGSFGDELIADAGGTNVFGADGDLGGYPNVDAESVIAANPQVIVLADGLDPASVGSRPGWSGIAAVAGGRVYAVNPDIFSEPGPRLVDALEQLAKDVHPEAYS